ncbi:MAG: haloacid dehalogenase type II [Chloroflexi bacterium]|nr:haloacid dehalogenase type II [Chloroflexota bacterium]
MTEPAIRALLFDVFGTVVDWRSGVAREVEALASARGIEVDGGAFADAWRAHYQPAMEAVRAGTRPFVPLDVLHRENLTGVVEDRGITAFTDNDLDELNLAWHRLDGWPDSAEGIRRLKARYIVATQSNGNIALMVEMAKHAGLEWDVILGAEVTGHYKPRPEAYARAAELLGLQPAECLMVAAHNGDLEAARSSVGMRTAFIWRPREFGPREAPGPSSDWDYVADDLQDLARQLGA